MTFWSSWTSRRLVRSLGGLSYDSFPVNSFEAESRRLTRFTSTGQTPGVMNVPPATINAPGSKEFPFTLDLRRS
jgi:uncharacterized protein (DUF2126 family)